MIKLGISSLSLGGVSQILSGISTISRNYTANTGTEVYDLTPHGVAPFSIPATTGYSLTSPNITVDTATVVGSVTVTDNNGDQFIFDASGLTTASVTVVGDVGAVTVGGDTDASKTISVTITGGVYDTEAVDWTGAQIAALSAGEGIPELAPTTQLTTDANLDGILDENDVLAVDREALYLYGELTAPTISYNVLDASDAVLGAAPYTVTAANITAANGPYKIRATDGANTIDSATVNIASGAWSPLDLGAKLLLWLDYSDTSTLWQDTSATTAATTNGDPIARIDDKSGNGRYYEQGTASKQPVVTTGGATFDAVDYLISSDTTFHQSHSDVLLGTAFNTTDTDYMMLNSRLTSSWVGLIQDGNTSTTLEGNSGTPSYRKNGAAITPSTRDDMHTEYSVGVNVAAVAEGVDMTGWPTTTWHGIYATNGSLSFAGKMSELILTTTLTTAERTELETWLARH